MSVAFPNVRSPGVGHLGLGVGQSTGVFMGATSADFATTWQNAQASQGSSSLMVSMLDAFAKAVKDKLNG